jgi:AraC family transcriptional regulator
MNVVAPSIVDLSPKKLLGKRVIMSIAEDKTGLLWASFMPHRKLIQHQIGQDLYSLQVFPQGYFNAFNPTTTFEKWALAEVEQDESIPENMESFSLPGGPYAVFNHKGMDTAIFQYIYSIWLPDSGFELDDRPHFEVLGKKYKKGSPDSEEEIWIPISAKNQ